MLPITPGFAGNLPATERSSVHATPGDCPPPADSREGLERIVDERVPESDIADFTALLGLVMGGFPFPQPIHIATNSTESTDTEPSTSLVSTAGQCPGSPGKVKPQFNAASSPSLFTLGPVPGLQTAAMDASSTVFKVPAEFDGGSVVHKRAMDEYKLPMQALTESVEGSILPTDAIVASDAVEKLPPESMEGNVLAVSGNRSRSNAMVEPGQGVVFQLPDTSVFTSILPQPGFPDVFEEGTRLATPEAPTSGISSRLGHPDGAILTPFDLASPTSALDDAISTRAGNNSSSLPSEDDAAMAGTVNPLPVLETRDHFRVRHTISEISAGKRRSTDSFDAELSPVTHSRPGMESQLHAGSPLADTSGTASLSSFTESIAAEVRQPLSAQVSRAVLVHLERQGATTSDSLTVRLDPPELGEMVIELSRTADGLAIRVTAREAVTMDMLLARGREIESQVRGREIDLKSLDFISSGMMDGQTSSGRRNDHSSQQPDSSQASVRPNSRRSTVAGSSQEQVVLSKLESPYALNFRA